MCQTVDRPSWFWDKMRKKIQEVQIEEMGDPGKAIKLFVEFLTEEDCLVWVTLAWTLGRVFSLDSHALFACLCLLDSLTMAILYSPASPTFVPCVRCSALFSGCRGKK